MRPTAPPDDPDPTATISNGESIPKPSSITDLQKTGECDGWVWALAEVDPALIDDTTERVNIALPRRILALLHQRVKSAGETRSGYIVQMTITH